MTNSYLFSLPLRGLGTAEVESLSSYLCRLSAAHSTSVKDVIEHAFRWLRRTSRPDIAMPFVTRSPESLWYYVRPNGMTHLLVEALAAATGRSDLRCATFLALEVAVSRCMGTFHRSIRWCPHCVQEFVSAEDEGYMKLQWLLCDLQRCPAHGANLIDRCPHCQRHQNGCARRERITHCVSCRQLLTVGVEGVPGPGSWKVEAADLIELVEDIATDASLLFPVEGPRAVLSELFDRVWKREEELRLWKIIPRDECLAIIDGTMPVSLRTARRIAYRLGLRLADLLAGTLSQTTPLLSDPWTESLPATMRPRRRSARRDRAQLSKALEDAVRRARNERPVALKAVAKGLGVSSGCLTYHFPELSRQLLKLHADWRQTELARKKLEARSAVLAYLSRRDLTIPVSHKRMLREIRTATNLPKELLRTEIAKHA